MQPARCPLEALRLSFASTFGVKPFMSSPVRFDGQHSLRVIADVERFIFLGLDGRTAFAFLHTLKLKALAVQGV
jgi:hypothetical protein